MLKKLFQIIAALLTAIIMVGIVTLPVQAESSVNYFYLYRLSDFSGTVSSMWARLAIDPEAGEVYTLHASGGDIRIFNDKAMQTYGFGENLGLASAVDLAAGDNGELFVLYRYGTIRHLDYRGELIRNIEVRPEQKADEPFRPAYVDYLEGRLYLADAGAMQVVVTTLEGEVEKSYDFRSKMEDQIAAEAGSDDLNAAQQKKLGEDLEKLEGAGFNGFSVDKSGNFYFTVPSFFSAYRVTPDGDMDVFGTPGSAPGKFGVVASIAADSQGNVYVSDRLRSVVLVFDSRLRFQTEFGYRGNRPENLIVPDDVVIDEQHNRIYVAQAANLGVSVFSYQSHSGS